MKYPWMQFYSGDWLKEPKLTVCTPATRGVWMDLLCVMHESGRVSELRGTVEILSRLARCSPADLSCALTELQTTGAADVSERNGVVTVSCRRLKREVKAREQTRLRVSEHRSGSDVTLLKRSCNGEIQIQSQTSDTKLRALSGQSSDKVSKLSKSGLGTAQRFEDALTDQWVNDAGKWVNRIKSNENKAMRVVAEVENAAKEGRIDSTPAQYAEQIWKEFK